MLVLGALRRAQMVPRRCNTVNFQNVAPRNLSSVRQNFRILGVRCETTTSKAAKPTANAAASPKPPPPPQTPRYAYPEKLCIYHAGTPRITFLACLKISTLFIFVFFGFVVTPAYFDREGLSPTVLRTMLSAIVPMVFVAYTTSPFVSFIHMRLPPVARQSEDMLRRFARAIPADAELEVTTMSFIAKPRVSRVKASELRPVSRRFGIVNLARDTAAENAARPWYRFRAVGQFNVQFNTASRAPWVWESIMATIQKQRA
ncbi:uncharacterized protein F4812DRAFT_444176 [Daldinia caldariorum]|uniref:uncharacterized protein n=1 Tax=Daldinia caldariorum TaxID=326644 RepID=UPI002008D915|nr:uncharacterized protein F4812DRAFT_444176 [Daldinia caldariorum]KAI1464004.1 hypothetical protein F4812DRAFT_444176 [Daldinia caldariorum]